MATLLGKSIICMHIITKMSDEAQSPKLAIWHSSNYTLGLYRVGQVDSYYNLHLQNNNAYNRNFLPYIRGGLGNTTVCMLNVRVVLQPAHRYWFILHAGYYLPTYHQEPIPNSWGILNRSHSAVDGSIFVWNFCVTFMNDNEKQSCTGRFTDHMALQTTTIQN